MAGGIPLGGGGGGAGNAERRTIYGGSIGIMGKKMETIICCEISSSQEGCGWGLTMVPSSQYMVIVGLLRGF